LISASAALRLAITASQSRRDGRSLSDRHVKSTAANVFPDVAEFKKRHTTGNSFE
jgi:hypothetical protein